MPDVSPERGHTLPKRERISGREAFSRLVKEGRYHSEGCFRYCLLRGNGLEYSRIAVSVPKRSFKRAVKRNLLKRRIRECYRLRKHLLSEGCDILFIYTPKEILPLDGIMESMEKVLSSISQG